MHDNVHVHGPSGRTNEHAKWAVAARVVYIRAANNHAGGACKLDNGTRLPRMKWRAMIGDRACSLASMCVRVRHWRCSTSNATTLHTCTLQRSCAGRFLPEAAATPVSRGHGKELPEACSPQRERGRPCCAACPPREPEVEVVLAGTLHRGGGCVQLRTGLLSTQQRGQLMSRARCTARFGALALGALSSSRRFVAPGCRSSSAWTRFGQQSRLTCTLYNAARGSCSRFSHQATAP